LEASLSGFEGSGATKVDGPVRRHCSLGIDPVRRDTTMYFFTASSFVALTPSPPSYHLSILS
jgi:hypothetical protein